MRSRGNQLDIFDHDPAVIARREAEAARIAAGMALIDPHFSPALQKHRHAHYLAEAEAFEQQAIACGVSSHA